MAIGNVHKIKLFGVIASDMEAAFFGDEGLITLSMVENELKTANGKDIEVDLSSVGGLVSVGVDIYFAFRDYKRNNPQAQMILNMKSQVASMASHIASGEFWDMVTAEDISSWMIHNPAMYVGGDYRIMKEASDHLERLAAMYSTSYKSRSKKPDKEIRAMMDKTTYLFGEEIVKNGFADEVLSTSEEKNRPSMIAQMELKYKSVMQKINQSESFQNGLQSAVARMQKEEPLTPEKTEQQKPATSGQNKTQEKIKMTVDELKKDHSDVHTAIMSAGESDGFKKGIEAEQGRVKSLIEMKKRKDFEGITMIHERIDEAIEKGESIADVQMAIVAMSLKGGAVSAALDSNEIGKINSGNDTTVSGEEGNLPEMKKEW
jgi:ATP-dependent protease ClpP protease subunit